ncbi:hypothetical protein [Roseibacillus persicicus]|uniref:hypothetical protein n=1 Tax=Roseibacillus persicicus TaxID=454148 RepID=UPI002810C4A9|nr:hypothetical protein [Roseibacillus persicicus]
MRLPLWNIRQELSWRELWSPPFRSSTNRLLTKLYHQLSLLTQRRHDSLSTERSSPAKPTVQRAFPCSTVYKHAVNCQLASAVGFGSGALFAGFFPKASTGDSFDVIITSFLPHYHQRNVRDCFSVKTTEQIYIQIKVRVSTNAAHNVAAQIINYR